MSQVLEPQTEAEAYAQPRKNNNCLIYGCLGAVLVFVLLLVGGGFATYFFVKGQLDKYTATESVTLPAVEYTPEQIQELEQRITSFQESIESESTPPPSVPDDGTGTPQPKLTELILTADDINALLNNNEKFRNRVFVKIEDGTVTGDISMPLDEAFPQMKGRFLNGSVTIDASVENGILFVMLENAEVKGEPIPEEIMVEIRKQNMAKDLNTDPQMAKIIRQFESVRVEGDKIIAKLKDQQPEEKQPEDNDQPMTSSEVELEAPDTGSTEASEPPTDSAIGAGLGIEAILDDQAEASDGTDQ